MTQAGPSGPPRLRSGGILFGGLFGGLTAVVSLTAIGRVWAACDIGTDAAADSMTLLFLAPPIWIATTVAWVVL
ncbi:hypothetical protein [Streptomyces adustus]|uniref:hypothetical protein n=1 Tax=Streptomyces adustus TaxID=1609272 RepID=UPI001EE46621|nr:hypothetical protein [Streptomyces adustus]